MAPLLPVAIAAALARGATIITPTQRAARAIGRVYDSAQQSAGRTLWNSPNILPLESWLASQWHQRLLNGTETRILLNRTQEHILWREIIQADSETPRLRSADALADLAARAWSLLNVYNALPRVREFALSTDTKDFDRWARAFERRLYRAQFITPSQLPAALTLDPQPTSLTLVDFDTLPPAAARLFQTLQAEHLQTSHSATEIGQHAADDDSSELQTAAHWIRERLDQDPNQTIAVVVPNLADRRAEIDRTFGAILSPESLPITAHAAAPVYEFSLGLPLAELPLIGTARDLLSWLLQPLPLDRISALLLSPFLTPPATSAVAAEFDASELRQLSLLRPELTLDRTLELLTTSHRREALAPLRDSLRGLRLAARSTQFLANTAHSYTTCAETIRTLLDSAGWTRNAERASLTFQQHRRFESVLVELATLDALADNSRPTASEALSNLNHILRQTIFAPESHNAPVQILGPLEVGGIPFDAIWFLSADDLTWPTPTAPNALIPWQLQRTLQMPGADRTHDDTAAFALTTRVVHSAATAVFSYARHSEEGDRRPSAFLSDLSAAPGDLSVLPLPLPSSPNPLETVADNSTLPPLPPGLTRGGSRILQLQAACPFRAFAETRLHSAEPEPRPSGLNPMERGLLVHKTMETFWHDVGTQSNLRNLSTEERAATLDHAIETAFAAERHPVESLWDETYLALERQRLAQLLNPWLDIELARPDFAVEGSEKEERVQLGPLTFKLRIDRIDATADGDLILDYKTGEADPTQWHGDRPDAPQLPLYAILAQQENRRVAGVGFAQLRPGKDLTFTGHADNPDHFPRGKAKPMLAPSLAEQIDQWKATLTNLALDFSAGVTRVDPKQYPETCKQCGQRILCRLNPALLAPAQLEDEESDDL